MNIQAVVTIPHRSGLPEDHVSNTWAIQTAAAWNPSTEVGEITIPLFAFYNVQVGANPTVANWLSPELNRTAGQMTIEIYAIDTPAKLAGGPKGSPIASDFSTLAAAAAGNAMPGEVAFCLSYRNTSPPIPPEQAPDGPDVGTLPDRPNSRRRGRIYLGPLNATAGSAGSFGELRPNALFAIQVRGAAQRLQDELQANGHGWSVWSRQDGQMNLVDQLSTDDAFDTQRRRGVAATSRTVEVVSSP